jgi:hypothetical protein
MYVAGSADFGQTQGLLGLFQNHQEINNAIDDPYRTV